MIEYNFLLFIVMRLTSSPKRTQQGQEHRFVVDWIAQLFFIIAISWPVFFVASESFRSSLCFESSFKFQVSSNLLDSAEFSIPKNKCTMLRLFFWFLLLAIPGASPKACDFQVPWNLHSVFWSFFQSFIRCYLFHHWYWSLSIIEFETIC